MIIEGVRAESVDDSTGWPFTLAPVAQLMRDGLCFDKPVTFLVGENGSGKSTIVEAIAERYGMSPRGGKAKLATTGTRQQSVLAAALRLELTPDGQRRASRSRLKSQSYFLRAETAFDFIEFISSHNVILPGFWQEDLRMRSHGEGFITVLETVLGERGLFLMDEPESAMSFTSTLRLLALIDETRRIGSQVICATHSPVLAALPSAQILELGEHGIREVAWRDLELVDHWRRFLSQPDSYLRHIVDG